MKKTLAFVIAFLSFTPMLAMAQSNPTGILSILNTVSLIVSYVIPILITAGVGYFIYGVLKYVTSKDEDTRKESKDAMIYGIIGLFVIISIWGLIKFLGSALGVSQSQSGVQGTTNCLIYGGPNCF